MRNSSRNLLIGLSLATQLAGCSPQIEQVRPGTGKAIPIWYVMQNRAGEKSTFFGWDLDADLATVDEGFLVPGEWNRNSNWFTRIDAGEVRATHLISNHYSEGPLYKLHNSGNNRFMTEEEERVFNTGYQGHNIFD